MEVNPNITEISALLNSQTSKTLVPRAEEELDGAAPTAAASVRGAKGDKSPNSTPAPVGRTVG